MVGENKPPKCLRMIIKYVNVYLIHKWLCLFYVAQRGIIRNWVEVVRRQFGLDQYFSHIRDASIHFVRF